MRVTHFEQNILNFGMGSIYYFLRIQFKQKTVSPFKFFKLILFLYNHTVKTGFLLMSQKSLFLSTSCTQNCPETKRLKFEKPMFLYLKCMLFLKVSQHALIFETLLFLKMSRLILIFEITYYSNVI